MVLGTQKGCIYSITLEEKNLEDYKIDIEDLKISYGKLFMSETQKPQIDENNIDFIMHENMF